MPAPATTGQLRTKVSEMEIGDYIKAHNNGVDYSFNDNSITEELSLNGGTSPNHTNRFFYFVKVSKGLLIADRVTLNSYSWDNLNAGKWIQGRTLFDKNSVPIMTSNTSPSGKAIASSVFDSTYEPWKAFNQTNTNYADCWASASGEATGWLGYEFPEAQIITSYAITTRNTTASSSGRTDPVTWTFEGSNNGENWVTLHQVIKERDFAINEKRNYTFPNKTAYKMYRINVTESKPQGSTNVYLSIGRLEMFETAGIIRSLTGGVAYADANGNKSLTNQGYGAWPVNNEWDKYIVNFPVSKMQEGKTLDDIFHWNSAVTFTQDTPMNGVLGENNSTGTNSTRIGRSRTGSSINSIQVASSNGSWASWGFRPVFEYKE